MPIAIDQNVPMPKALKSKYPFKSMNVGDSFIVPAGEEAKCRLAAYKLEQGGHHNNDGNPISFTFRTDITGDLRCWRLS